MDEDQPAAQYLSGNVASGKRLLTMPSDNHLPASLLGCLSACAVCAPLYQSSLVFTWEDRDHTAISDAQVSPSCECDLLLGNPLPSELPWLGICENWVAVDRHAAIAPRSSC